jgi:hypothetical protein
VIQVSLLSSGSKVFVCVWFDSVLFAAAAAASAAAAAADKHGASQRLLQTATIPLTPHSSYLLSIPFSLYSSRRSPSLQFASTIASRSPTAWFTTKNEWVQAAGATPCHRVGVMLLGHIPANVKTPHLAAPERPNHNFQAAQNFVFVSCF